MTLLSFVDHFHFVMGISLTGVWHSILQHCNFQAFLPLSHQKRSPSQPFTLSEHWTLRSFNAFCPGSYPQPHTNSRSFLEDQAPSFRKCFMKKPCWGATGLCNWEACCEIFARECYIYGWFPFISYTVYDSHEPFGHALWNFICHIGLLSRDRGNVPLLYLKPSDTASCAHMRLCTSLLWSGHVSSPTLKITACSLLFWNE